VTPAQIKFPETRDQIRKNRTEFLAALRDPANEDKAMKGGMFRSYPTGEKCCSVGLAAGIFLGIHNERDYYNATSNDRGIYNEINRMLGEPEHDWFIDNINDVQAPDDDIFGYVADVLAERWRMK
jgi:hypothetical protein